jgi:3-hydroxyacyl-CoA dehydrogenase/enoyl-CoA hydratase/3-hydroxybutyryl-CoA epimerase
MPWSGGPFAWLDILGTARALEIADIFVARFGPRFAPPALLRELAEKGESFYGRYQPTARAA